MELLKTEDLTKTFGEQTAVDSVDYTIEEGEVASIIGPNGAGKTTFFNLITGEYDVSNGRVLFSDEDVTELPTHERVHRGMGRVFQITNVFPELTTFENIRIAVQSTSVKDVRGMAQDAYGDDEIISRTNELIEKIDMSHQREQTATTLPHGDKRRLEFGMALALKPKLLLLDEPTAGLPDAEVHEITDFIRTLAGEFTILLVEHKMDVVMGLSDRVSVFHHGQLIADDTVEGIKDNQQVQDVYLGEGARYA